MSSDVMRKQSIAGAFVTSSVKFMKTVKYEEFFELRRIFVSTSYSTLDRPK